MLVLEIAAGILLAAFVFRFWRAALVLFVIVPAIGVSLLLFLWGVPQPLVIVVLAISGYGIFLELRERRSLKPPGEPDA